MIKRLFNKKWFRIIFIITMAYITFFIMVLIGFNAVQKINSTPLDLAVKEHFYFDEDFEEEYGIIYSMGRNHRLDIVEDEQKIKAPFNVYAEHKEFTMYVTLEKHNENFIVIGYEIVEEL